MRQSGEANQCPGRKAHAAIVTNNRATMFKTNPNECRGGRMTMRQPNNPMTMAWLQRWVAPPRKTDNRMSDGKSIAAQIPPEREFAAGFSASVDPDGCMKRVIA